MTSRKLVTIAAGVAALGLPALASAQAYGYGGGGDYNAYQGGWYERRFPGYPEFRGEEEHIQREIQEAVREDMIEQDDAADLFARLRDIRAHEAREFSFHGWNLPEDDRREIRARLDELDRTVDDIRNEP